MKRVLKELVDLCIQEEPEYFKGSETEEDVMECFVYAFAAANRIQTYHNDVFMKSLDSLTLEECVTSYENGYSAIINDGRIIGFKKAV